MLSLFIANLQVRTPELRDTQQAIDASLRESLVREGSDADQIREVLRRSGIADPSKRESVELMFSLSGSIAPHLHARTWILGNAPRGGLITSDHPVAVYQHQRDPLRGTGVANANEVHFPIDPSTVLLMVHPRFGMPEKQISLTADNALFEQSLIASYSYEYIYQLPSDAVLRPEVAPVGPRPLLGMGADSLVYAPRHVAQSGVP